MILENSERCEDLEWGRELAWHLQSEGEKLIASWAVVEAAWSCLLPAKFPTKNYLFRSLDLANAFEDLQTAAMRDALMTLGRLTDNRSCSLFGSVNLLADQNISRALQQTHSGEKFDRAHRFLICRVGNFAPDLKAKTWSESEQKRLRERPYTLMKCRAELDRFRNAQLAHAGDKTPLGGLWLPYFAKAVLLSALATEAAFYVFTGHDWRSMSALRRKIASQREMKRSLSIEFFDQSASPFVRSVWQRAASKNSS